MSGGVNGRQVTFVLQPNTTNMTAVYFLNYPNGSFNGTGIYIYLLLLHYQVLFYYNMVKLLLLFI